MEQPARPGLHDAHRDRHRAGEPYRHFRAVCDAAGIRRVRLHDLRHTCATILLAQGVDTRTIMEILGHSTIVLTMNTYAHVLPEHQATALDKLEKALGGLA
ncbi:tyrosine-type recombinase/integrase [Sphaerimonospora sp. CA-214678]|uniref:tyrosine-type recombinase/integrase n=1 Tax=Sphaerimonospora sp. CA-214678 TaxID=3240029 RepID=UPI003D8D61C8